MMNRRRFGQTLVAGAVLPAASILPAATAMAAPTPAMTEAPPSIVDDIEAQMREIEARIGHMRLKTDLIRQAGGLHFVLKRGPAALLLTDVAGDLHTIAKDVARLADEQQQSAVAVIEAAATQRDRLSACVRRLAEWDSRV